ncbi:hypothetical protein Q3G72_008606 [Acer saccharum]|nr:hypothetical protein Q3G72_008606 [Acer saccharum]
MDDCANISSAISGNLLQHLNSLEKLHVRNGDSLEEVFDLEELNADGDLKVLSQLRKDISATPSIFKGTLYFPSSNGNSYAIKASVGALVWKKNVHNLTGLTPKPGLVANVNWTVSRATPTIIVDDDHDLLIIGVYGPAYYHVYIATGNLYSVPPHKEECQEREYNQTVPTHSDECVEPDNHSNSILALDLDSGKIKWYHQLGGYDLWFFACNNLSTPGCPPGPIPDVDFGVGTNDA